MIEPTHHWNTSFKPVWWGFGLSLVLTALAYFLVGESIFSGWGLIIPLVVLAITQGVIQLVLFLHLGVESKPRWNLMIFLFMVLIMVIILFGSMWIMRNLSYNTMNYKQYGKH